MNTRDEYRSDDVDPEGGFSFGGSEQCGSEPDLFTPPDPTAPELFERPLDSTAPVPEALRTPDAEEGAAQVNGPGPSHFGVNLFGEALDPGRSKGKLGDFFLLPPFTVLDTRQGYWQDRRRAWLAHGIRSEVGRIRDAKGGGNANSVYGGTNSFADDRGPKIDREVQGPSFFQGDQLRNSDKFTKTSIGGNLLKFSPMMSIPRNGDGFDGSKIYTGEISKDGAEANSTSIFDPVLCELCYRWFCPPGGRIIDPFAGGSVRGVLAGLLERAYVGIDLREEQVSANREQCAMMGQTEVVEYHCADALAWLKSYQGRDFDFIFSCPPYADLERYSEEPDDLSTMDYPDFLVAYQEIIAYAVAVLKPNRFAAFVVTEIREKTREGFYRGFVADTVHAFEQAGARYYNEAVIVNSIGSLPLRVQRQFTVSRKLGRTHQYLLVFCKGDPREAAKATPMVALSTNQAEEKDEQGDGA